MYLVVLSCTWLCCHVPGDDSSVFNAIISRHCLHHPCVHYACCNTGQSIHTSTHTLQQCSVLSATHSTGLLCESGDLMVQGESTRPIACCPSSNTCVSIVAPYCVAPYCVAPYCVAPYCVAPFHVAPYRACTMHTRVGGMNIYQQASYTPKSSRHHPAIPTVILCHVVVLTLGLV